MVIEKKYTNITLHKFHMEPSSGTDLFPHYASVAMASVLPLLPLPFSSLSKPQLFTLFWNPKLLMHGVRGRSNNNLTQGCQCS